MLLSTFCRAAPAGKMLRPRLGFLDMCVEPYLAGEVSDVYLVPASINYERPLETLLYSHEVRARVAAWHGQPS